MGIVAVILTLVPVTGVHGWHFVPLLIVGFMLYSIAWPSIVRLKPWTPWRYWLPKSRLLGYTVYLVIPVATMIFVIFLAAHFKWGM